MSARPASRRSSRKPPVSPAAGERRGRQAARRAALLATAVLAAACAATSVTAARPTVTQPTSARAGSTGTTPTTQVAPRRPHRHAPRPALLLPPAALRPFSSAGDTGQGRWHPAGRLVGGHAAVYETTLVAPGSTSASGIAWMDPRLLRAQLYSGSLSPGHGPWSLTAPISPSRARTVVAAFNGGFKFPAAGGGYYAEGRMVYPLRQGGASLVIYRNGDVTVGSWGRDVRMTSQVVAVRQNLTLLVDGGKPVPGLNAYDTGVWGATLGGVPAVWRSGVGITASGALVYVTGPSLEITQLAALLVRAGCIRAMTLDMNPDWTVFVTFDPVTPRGAAAPGNGTDLLPGTVQGPYTFFESWWARDFITMAARG